MILNNPPTEEDYKKYKSRELMSMRCHQCDKIFSKFKHRLQGDTSHNDDIYFYCSVACSHKHRSRVGSKIIKCDCCGKEVKKKVNDLNRSKSGKHFCSRKCSVSYNNTHKKYGYRRSKLELFLEDKLNKIYPFEIKYNCKEDIESELDIYIPSLKLAFELNGIFHYEPIFGADQLKKIQNNDGRKFQACLERKIELCIIDASKTKNFNEEKYLYYLNIVRNIIDNKIKSSNME